MTKYTKLLSNEELEARFNAIDEKFSRVEAYLDIDQRKLEAQMRFAKEANERLEQFANLLWNLNHALEGIGAGYTEQSFALTDELLPAYKNLCGYYVAKEKPRNLS